VIGIPARRRPELYFALAAASVYTVGTLALAGPRGDGVVPTAVSLDLTLFVPALWYVFLVRGRALPAATVAPVFLLSLVGARLVLPAGEPGAPPLVGLLGVPAELLLLGLVARQWVRARRSARGLESTDVVDRLRAAARVALGGRRAADVVAYEIAVLWYALASWRRAPAAGDDVFSYHRKTGYGSVVAALLLAIAAESLPVHLLLSRWSVKAAWILTALGLYGALWLIGDYRAMRLRPTLLDGPVLRLRHGLRWSLDVPLTLVRGAREAGRSDDATGADLTMALRGAKVVRLEFEGPLAAHGFYGRKKTVRSVVVGADDPARLAATIERRLVAPE